MTKKTLVLGNPENLTPQTTALQQQILKFAKFAKLAYDKPEVTQKGIEKSSEIVDPKTNGYAKILQRKGGNQIIVSFRGTVMTSLDNWFTNAKIPKDAVFCDNCEVHSGFLDAYSALITGINSQIKTDGCEIVFTGHSLGGALATIAAADFLFNPNNPLQKRCTIKGLITYGSPRVGNEIFANAFDLKLKIKNIFNMRVVNGNDMVPKVPAANFGFQHIGDEYKLYASNGAFIMIYSQTDLEKDSIALSLEDHGMDNYIQNIGLVSKYQINSDEKDGILNTVVTNTQEVCGNLFRIVNFCLEPAIGLVSSLAKKVVGLMGSFVDATVDNFEVIGDIITHKLKRAKKLNLKKRNKAINLKINK